MLKTGVSFANIPSAVPTLIKPKIRNIYMRDYITGHFSQYTSNLLPNTTLEYIINDPETCICNNILEEVIINLNLSNSFLGFFIGKNFF